MTYHQVCNYISTTGVTSGKGTAYPSGAPVFTPGFSGVRVTRSLVLCVCFVHLCLFFCPFFFWPSCCLSFFDLQIKITPLISSNSSHHLHISKHKTELCWLIKPIYMYLLTFNQYCHSIYQNDVLFNTIFLQKNNTYTCKEQLLTWSYQVIYLRYIII